MSDAIARLFNVPDGDADGAVRATAVSLMHKGMVRKMAKKVFNVKPNASAIQHLALSTDETVEFLSNVDSADDEGTLLAPFAAMLETQYPEVADKASGLFLYLYLMHEKDADGKILSKLAQGADLKALGADLKTFFNAHINPDTGAEIINKAGAVIQTLCERMDHCSSSSSSSSDSDSDDDRTIEIPKIPDVQVPQVPKIPDVRIPRFSAPVVPETVKVASRSCTAAYFTDNIVEEFRSVVGIEQSVDQSLVAQFLLAMYLPEQVTNTTGFVSLAFKLRLRPHHVEWARTYANHHPELSSHCWQTLADTVGTNAINEFVATTSRNLKLPCYASEDDKFISAMALTQFNYMSIIATRLRATTMHQDRHFRSMRASYMNNVPVDQLSAFFDSVVLPVRA